MIMCISVTSSRAMYASVATVQNNHHLKCTSSGDIIFTALLASYTINKVNIAYFILHKRKYRRVRGVNV